jgi:hypothetical protein
MNADERQVRTGLFAELKVDVSRLLAIIRGYETLEPG